jgi:hypothetical protein
MTASLQRKGLLVVGTDAAGKGRPGPGPWDNCLAIEPEFEALLPRAPAEVTQREDRLLVEGRRDPLVGWEGRRGHPRENGRADGGYRDKHHH